MSKHPKTITAATTRHWQLDLFLICFGIVLATLFRVWLVHGYNFPFWFDSARDATVSREILENHHLKLQGPNASGTNDTVFHGVLYYYLVGPLYTLAKGDPQPVVYVLGFLSALAIVPLYLLTQELFASRRVSVIAIVGYALSVETARAGTWLGNPVIATVAVPFFFYFLWLVFFRQQKKYWLWLALCIGIATQAVLFLVVLWVGVLISAWYAATKNNFYLRPFDWVKAGGIYLLTISSMILVEVKIVHAGLFHWANLSDLTALPVTAPEAVGGVLQLYLQKLANTLLPSFPVAAVLIFVIVMVAVLPRLEKPKQFFLILLLSFPLWLLGWNYREMYHVFIGLEIPIWILVAAWCSKLTAGRTNQVLLGILLIVFVLSNGRAVVLDQQFRRSDYVLPQGAYIKDQLAMIAKTYELSHGKPFSISTLTNPYGYDTTWAYLYRWYAQTHGLALPSWFGPTQAGIFGGTTFSEVAHPQALHFSIYEPKDGIPVYLEEAFHGSQQSLAGTPSATLQFGSLTLEEHTQ